MSWTLRAASPQPVGAESWEPPCAGCPLLSLGTLRDPLPPRGVEVDPGHTATGTYLVLVSRAQVRAGSGWLGGQITVQEPDWAPSCSGEEDPR